MRRSRLLRAGSRGGGDEGLIPLVNVVFLLMLFFLIAGEIAAHDTSGVVVPASSRTLEAAASAAPELLLDADGRLRARDGAPTDPETIEPGPLALRVDHAAEAAAVVAIAWRLEEAGARPLYMILEKR